MYFDSVINIYAKTRYGCLSNKYIYSIISVAQRNMQKQRSTALAFSQGGAQLLVTNYWKFEKRVNCGS